MKNLDLEILEGIKDGRYAFKGPRVVQLDLTGRCNNECIGCWVHSPYVKNPPPDKNLTLPFEEANALIEELALMGTEEVILSGAGEPFLYPKIMEIIELIKRKNLKLNIITNFSLLDHGKAQRLIDLGVDMLTASIWAGTGETYAKTHPEKNSEDFLKIKENLARFSSLKAIQKKCLPQIKIYNVICNLNFNEIKEMIYLGLAVGVESVEFQIMDIIKGATEFLALSSEQIKGIKKQFYELLRSDKLYFKELEVLNLNEQNELMEFPGRFMEIPKGIFLKEWFDLVLGVKRPKHDLVCLRGLTHASTTDNPLVEESYNRLTFTLPIETCKMCDFFGKQCPVDVNGKIAFSYLTLKGYGTFMRRLNSACGDTRKYESDVIDSIPCYVGWEYARVLSTGKVIPCCKSVNNALGSLKKKRFSEIWNSRKYQDFRHNAISLKKSHRYFQNIQCLKFCDNLGMNLEMQKDVLADKKNIHAVIPARQLKNNLQKALPRAGKMVFIYADQLRSGNLNSISKKFGRRMVIDGGHESAFAEYEVNFLEPGVYELFSCYASNAERPVELSFDGRVLTKTGMSCLSGGWTREFCGWFGESALDVAAGKHVFKIYAKNPIPHIYAFAFLKGIEARSGGAGSFQGERIYALRNPLGLLKDKLKNADFFAALRALGAYVFGGKLLNNYLDILGIYAGEYAFKGPYHVQIDLTNDCNNDCIACWCNSPLLEEKVLSSEVKKKYLPLEMVKQLLDDLALAGTKEIYFSGGGEPFMHPQIMEILEYAKKKSFVCYVNTNFTLLTKEKLTKLIDIGVDHLTVSTWAATPQTYAATHPNKSEKTFEEIRENLRFLNMTKIKTPYVKLYNVISNRNFFELRDMVSFARETQSESVEFTLVDTMPGKTDKLLLDPVQSKTVQNAALQIAGELDKENRIEGVCVFGFHSFLRRISSLSDLAKATYDRNIIDWIPCYIGWTFARVMPNGDINGCLKAHRIPTGNLYRSSFEKIWNGELQKKFRRKTLVLEKTDPFFFIFGNDHDTKEVGCYKSCDDVGRNGYIHNRIMSLTKIEKWALKFIAKLMKKKALKKAASVDLVVKGAVHGERAFAGPEQVVMDVTNRCNEKCVGCWLHSPLLRNPPAKDWLRQELDLFKAKALIKSFKKLKVKEVRFTGGGEPLMYPGTVELIRCVKSHKIRCSLTTNFSLANKAEIKKLLSSGLDELTVSFWASNGAVYQKTHPGATADLFGRIDENLKYLIREKKNNLSVILSHVICKLNYDDIESMFSYALDLGVDGIYYTLIDTLEGTEGLILNPEERRWALEKAERVRERWLGLPTANKLRLDYFEGFICRLKGAGALTGHYDENKIEDIPCYAGWAFSRILANGDVAPCCRGVKKIMGNVNELPFEKIWFSDRYNEFRAKAKTLSKKDNFFREIGCLKECDNLMHSEDLHRRIYGK